METKIIKLDINDFCDTHLYEAAEIIRSGGLAAFPTETVYGLGGNALDSEAADKIYKAKGRPSDNPLIIHISCAEDIFKYCNIENKELFDILRKNFMPGPLTVIYPKKDIIPLSVTGGLDTVAVRFPSHPIAQRLIALSGVPIAAPSANLSGRPSPTKASHVIEDLSGRIDMIIDGGDCSVGLESTVISVKDDKITLLRPGGITYEDLKRVWDKVEIDKNVLQKTTLTSAPPSPGMKYRHYSPATPLFAVKGSDERVIKLFKEKLGEGALVICYDEDLPHLSSNNILSLGKRDKKEEAANRLFDLLRSTDSFGVSAAYVRLPESSGMGLASLNRLLRACGFAVLDANTLVVGICGQSGAGKSVLCNMLAKDRRFVHADCDKIYHDIISSGGECLDKLIETFGKGIIDNAGQLDRKALSKIVFADEEKRQVLNKITHAYILKKVKQMITQARLEGKMAVLVEAPLLFESGFDKICDITVGVVAEYSEKQARIIKRDGLDEKSAKNRLLSQIPDTQLMMRCDFIVENNKEEKSLKKAAKKLIAYIEDKNMNH